MFIEVFFICWLISISFYIYPSGIKQTDSTRELTGGISHCYYVTNISSLCLSSTVQTQVWVFTFDLFYPILLKK